MTYASEVLADSPTHWWRGKEPFGNLGQDYGSGLLPMLHTGIGLGFTGPTADDISMYSTGGASSKSSTAVSTNPVPVPYTVELWNFPVVAAGAGVTAAMIRCETAANGWSIFYNGGYGGYDIRASVKTNINFPAVSLGAWHHFALTHDGTNLRIYLDGTLRGTSPSLGHQSYDAAISINDQNPQSMFIAEVATYATALSGTRLLAHFGAGELRFVRPVYAGVLTQNDANTYNTTVLAAVAAVDTDTSTLIADYVDLNSKLDLILAAVRTTFP